MFAQAKQWVIKQVVSGWLAVDGWKTVIGYAAANIPFLVGSPLLVAAIEKVVNDPSEENIAQLIAQTIIAAGIVDRVRKNVKDLLAKV